MVLPIGFFLVSAFICANPRLKRNTTLESEKAKTLVREYFHRLLNEKDLSVCEEMLSHDYIDHDAPADVPPGPNNTKEFVAQFLHDYPDMRVDIEDIIAESNKVAARIIWHGTKKKSGEIFHQMGIVFLRLNEAGQLAERWSVYTSIQ